MRAFSSESEFLDAIAERWPGGGTELEQALRDGVGAAESEARSEQGAADGSLDLRLGSWVLRSEDLPVAEAIGLVGAALAAALAPGAIAAGAVVTAVTGFATLCWKAWRKGAPLSRDEIAVLGLLQVHGPMTLEQLQKRAASELEGLAPDDVERTLQSLTDVELRDGRLVELVRQDASGRWRARPV